MYLYERQEDGTMGAVESRHTGYLTFHSQRRKQAKQNAINQPQLIF